MATTSKSGDKPVKPSVKKTATQPKAAKAQVTTGVAKAPAVKKPAAPKAPAKTATTAAKKSAPAKKIAAPAIEQSAIPVLTLDQRRYYVEVAAYYIAERRGFHGGSQMDDWVLAEADIDRLVREGILKP